MPIIAIVVLAAFGLVVLHSVMSTNTLTGRHAPGARLLHAPETAGVEKVPMASLLTEASAVLGRQVDPETLALAKMLKSEGDSDNAISRRIRAWVAYNDLKSLQDGHGFEPMSFVELFQFSTSVTSRGYFGIQTGRRYATQADPYVGDYLDAETLRQEFQNTSNDLTNGATKFVDVPALATQPGVKPGTTLATLEKDWGVTFRKIPGAREGLVVA